MASTYSSLKIELIGTGDQAGTWGQTTNTNLGTAIEEAITGSANVTFASSNVAIALTDTNAAQTARNLRLNLTGTITNQQYLFVPAIEKQYLIANNLSNSVIIANGSNSGASGTTFTLPSGRSTIVFNDGTNITDVITFVTSLSNVSLSNASITGGTINNVTSNASTFSNATLINSQVNAYTEAVLALGNTGNAVTLNISNATIVTATLTNNCTWTMPGNTAGKSFVLMLRTGSGGFTSTFTGVRWNNGNVAPTITATANCVDIISFIADGVNWYGNYSQNYPL